MRATGSATAPGFWPGGRLSREHFDAATAGRPPETAPVTGVNRAWLGSGPCDGTERRNTRYG